MNSLFSSRCLKSKQEVCYMFMVGEGRHRLLWKEQGMRGGCCIAVEVVINGTVGIYSIFLNIMRVL